MSMINVTTFAAGRTDRRRRRRSSGLSLRSRGSCATGVLRFAAASMAIAALLRSAPPAQADVTASGDVVPAIDVDDGFGGMIKVPNLPEFGGEVTENSGRVVVGGTGEQIGDTDTGLLTIDDPFETAPLQSKEAIIGGDPDEVSSPDEGKDVGVGQVRILGLNSEWRVDDFLMVGGTGQGFLELLAGARTTSRFNNASPLPTADTVVGFESTSQGFAVVNGFGSAMISNVLSVGQRGAGRIEVSNLARLEARQDAVIGAEGDFDNGVFGSGFVLVDGQGTRFNVGNFSTGASTGNKTLTVGDSGRGILEVRNQALTRIESDIHIGRNEGGFGEVLVTDQGSSIVSFSQIFVGSSNSSGAGELHIDNQGLARAFDSVVVEINGLVDLDGGVLLTPSTINNGVISGSGRIESPVTNAATGDIRNAAGLADIRQQLKFTQPVLNGGLIESLGGEMEFLQLVTNTTGGQIAGRDAVYRFQRTATGFGLENDGTLFFSAGNSDIFGDVINNATGDISVGHNTVLTFYDRLVSDGLINILAGGVIIAPEDVTLSAGSTFSVTLADLGLGALGQPQLQAAGNVSLGGVLDPGLYGFTPEMGAEYVIIDAGSVSGTFSGVVQPRDFAWEVVYNSDNVVLRALAPPVGGADFNGDGRVDGLDFDAWQMNFGTNMGAVLVDGDANGDGDVDGFDFLQWQSEFGTVPAVVAATAVPEPTAIGLGLCVLGALSLGGRCERSRRNRAAKR